MNKTTLWNQLQKMTPKQSALLAFAAVLCARMNPGKPGIGTFLLEDEHGRPMIKLFVAQGITHIGEMDHAVNDIEGMLRTKPRPRICRFCGCTEAHACPGGCSWEAKDCCSHPGCTERRDPGGATQDFLSLVCCDVPKRVIRKWTPQQVELAEKWAGAVHLRASDNIVRVPPMPKFLKPFLKDA